MAGYAATALGAGPGPWAGEAWRALPRRGTATAPPSAAGRGEPAQVGADRGPRGRTPAPSLPSSPGCPLRTGAGAVKDGSTRVPKPGRGQRCGLEQRRAARNRAPARRRRRGSRRCAPGPHGLVGSTSWFFTGRELAAGRVTDVAALHGRPLSVSGTLQVAGQGPWTVTVPAEQALPVAGAYEGELGLRDNDGQWTRRPVVVSTPSAGTRLTLDRLTDLPSVEPPRTVRLTFTASTDRILIPVKRRTLAAARSKPRTPADYVLRTNPTVV